MEYEFKTKNNTKLVMNDIALWSGLLTNSLEKIYDGELIFDEQSSQSVYVKLYKDYSGMFKFGMFDLNDNLVELKSYCFRKV